MPFFLGFVAKVLEAAGLSSSLKRTRILDIDTGDREIRKKGTSSNPSHILEHLLISPDDDFIEEEITSPNINSVTTAQTLHKADGTTDIKAPAGSELLIAKLRVIPTGGGITSSSTFVFRGTTLADNAGSSADDITEQFSQTGTGGGTGNEQAEIQAFNITVPAGKFLTFVWISNSGLSPPTNTSVVDGMVLGTETF